MLVATTTVPQFVATNKERRRQIAVTASSEAGLRFFIGPLNGQLWEKRRVQFARQGGYFFLLSEPNVVGIHTVLIYPERREGTCFLAKVHLVDERFGALLDQTPYIMHPADTFDITTIGAACRVSRK